MSDSKVVFVLAILVVLATAIVVFVVWLKKHFKFLCSNSIAIGKLNELNNQYIFYKSQRDFDESHTYDNENFFNGISCEDYLIYQLQFKKRDIVDEIKLIKSNAPKYNKYCQEVCAITCFGQYKTEPKMLNKKMLFRLEQKIFNKSKQKPACEFNIYVRLNCAKINGVVYANKRKCFSSAEILNLIARVNNRSGHFYNDRYIWDAICRVERGRVSNKMRFAIYERDGYRCRICGASQRYAYLEIDHIKPIAKGGKSTYDNLQTLCHRCNKIKSDKY